MSNSHFDEKSGVICHEIDFGRWYQVSWGSQPKNMNF